MTDSSLKIHWHSRAKVSQEPLVLSRGRRERTKSLCSYPLWHLTIFTADLSCLLDSGGSYTCDCRSVREILLLSYYYSSKTKIK